MAPNPTKVSIELARDERDGRPVTAVIVRTPDTLVQTEWMFDMGSEACNAIADKIIALTPDVEIECIGFTRSAS